MTTEKKNLIFLFMMLLSASGLYAEWNPKVHANPDYKLLKVSAKVIEHDSDFYRLQIDLINTGEKAVSFWLMPSDYDFNFAFSAVGILICDNPFLKTKQFPKLLQEIRMNLLPRQKHTISTWCHIVYRDKFLTTKNNLRLIFIYNDGNMTYGTDMQQITSQDSIVYNW